ncbi:MAG: PD40 domain-containing protein [Acidobacteriia bacterium]|nr:PD40 domain-containing protein [Terriglobia bacterium]
MHRDVIRSNCSTYMQSGEQISHYRILSLLGTGGMGEVWLARDTLLNRNVAVKIPHAKMAQDPEWLRRFVQEARAVAALNHPNIAHVHELCEDGPLPMIVMEYVEGRTLSERIREGALPLDRILDIGIQVVSALEEAHGKGIIHRDIKPGNIMITPRGQVKVLDFGVAKKLSFSISQVTTSSSAAYEPDTEPGQVRGTLRYMSREQCIGADFDHRSDLFSLGAVLHEMSTGEYAFAGSTPALIYDAILNRTTPAPSAINAALPAEFDHIVLKALQKDREYRYHSASDLRHDLEVLKRATDKAGGRAGALSPAARSSYAAPVLIALLLTIAGGVAYFNLRRSSQPNLALESVPLTSAQGTESQPSFSPDGNQLAYAWSGENEDNWDIYVKMIQPGPSLRLTSSPHTDYSPAWSPDGSTIAFLRISETGGSGFYLISALGGSERRLSGASTSRTGVESPFLAWSPDGKHLAIADKSGPADPMMIQLLDVATGARTRLTHPPANAFGDSGVVYAPDGKMIFFVRSNGMGIQDVYSVPVTGGEPRRLTNDNRRVYGLTWNPADNRLLIASGRQNNARIWRLSPAGGEPQRVLGIGETASFLAIPRKGQRLAFTRAVVDTNIWRYDLSGVTPPRRVISSTRLEQGPQYAPEGKRVVFASTRTGAWEIFTSDVDGNNPLQLTSFNDKPAGSPQWSPDGKSIAFDARPGGNADIFTLSVEGGVAKRITTDPAQDSVPTYSRDGKSIYFGSNRTGQFEIWKVAASGGTATQVTRNGGFYAQESPDGKYLYYARSLDEPGLWRMPLPGGPESPVIETLRAGYWGYCALHPKGIYFVDMEGTAEVGLQYFLKNFDLATGKISKVLTLAKRPFNSGLALSPDGKQILYTQADRSDTDIMLVDGFR